MRKVTYFVASSLDGFIAKKDGGIDWLFTDADYGFKEFTDSIDTLLMGRATFDVTRKWGETWPGKTVLVFSKTQKGVPIPGVKYVNEEPRNAVTRLKSGAGKNIWLVGGAGLASQLFAANLVDELVLSIHPVTLGEGIPLFPKTQTTVQWEYVSSKDFQSGLLQIKYRLRT
jgi:dihydrofolate reductase